MQYQNNNQEIDKKFSEIQNLESEFEKVPSYTRAMCLIEKWEEYKCLVKEETLINLSKNKISFYSNFVNGKISKEAGSILKGNSLEKAATNSTFPQTQ